MSTAAPATTSALCRICENENITPPADGDLVKVLWRPEPGERPYWRTLRICEAHLAQDDRVEKVAA